MQCPECSFDSPPGMKFCGECGTKLPIACGACGAEVVGGFKFCGHCGERLAPSAPEPSTPTAGEKREPKVLPAPPAPSNAEATADAHARVDTLPEGEIKQATVLQCELVCQPGVPSGAERLHQLMNEFLELART